MTKKLLNMLAGALSSWSIFPATDYSRFVPENDAESRMRSHWLRTGNLIRNATQRYANEQTNKSTSQ